MKTVHMLGPALLVLLVLGCGGEGKQAAPVDQSTDQVDPDSYNLESTGTTLEVRLGTNAALTLPTSSTFEKTQLTLQQRPFATALEELASAGSTLGPATTLTGHAALRLVSTAALPLHAGDVAVTLPSPVLEEVRAIPATRLLQAFSLEQLGSVTLPLSVVPSLLIPASALPSNPRVEHGYQLIGLEPSVGKMQHKHQTIESDATYLVALLIVREADGAVHKVRCRHLDQTVALREGLYLFCPLSGELTAPTLDVLVFSTTYRNFLQLSLGEEPLLFLKDKVDLAGQPNRTPTLNLAQHYQAYPGVETFLTVAAEDEDQDALFLSVEGLPSFAEQLHQYLVFAPTSAAVGQTSTFTVSVRDNGNPSLTVSAEVKVEVVAPPRLPASGLKTCYDETTTRECAEIAARYPAQEAAKGAPPRALEQAEGGILHDGDTGLRWAVKQVETEATQHAAAMICKALVTESGEQWRLPSRRELLSVASFGAENTLLGLALEKDPSTDQAWFWTSEVLVTDKADFWAVRFHPVGIESADADRPGAVLCVAGAPWAARRQGSFQRNVSNTAVLDRDWGLEWQVDNKAERKTWAGAFEYCAGLELDGKTGWRVPGIRELESILQLEQDPNPFDAAAFLEFSLAASAPVFWTSTTEASRPDTAWTISMEDGTLIPQRKTAFGSVCCVR